MFSLKKLKSLNPKNMTLKDLKKYSPIIIMIIITLVKMYMKKKKEQDPNYKPTLVLKQDGTYVEGFEDTMSNSLISTMGVLGVNDDVASSTDKLLHIGSIKPPNKANNEFKSLVIDVFPKNANESYRQTFGLLLSGNTKDDIHMFKKSHFKNLYDESGGYTAYPGNINGFYGLGIIKNKVAHTKGHSGTELIGKFDSLEECKIEAVKRNLPGFVYHKPELGGVWAKTCYTFGNRTNDEVINHGKTHGRSANIQTYLKNKSIEFTDIFDYIDVTLNNSSGNLEVFLKISDSVNTIKDIPVIYYGSGLNKNTDSVLVNNSNQSPLGQISSLITNNYKNFDYTIYPKDFIQTELNDLVIKADNLKDKTDNINPDNVKSMDLYRGIAKNLNKNFGISYNSELDRYEINTNIRLSQNNNYQSRLRFNSSNDNFYSMALNKDDATFNLTYNDDINNGYVLHHSGTNEFRIPSVKDSSNNQNNGLTVSNKWRFSIDDTKKTLDIYQNSRKDFRFPTKNDPYAYQKGMPGNEAQKRNTMNATKATYGIGNIEGFTNLNCIHNDRNNDNSCNHGQFNEYRYFIGTNPDQNVKNQYLKVGKLPLGTKAMLNIELYPNTISSGFSRHSIFVYVDGIKYKCINELHYGSGDLLYLENGNVKKTLVGNERNPYKPYNWTAQDNQNINNGMSEKEVCESVGNRVYKGKVAEGDYIGCGSMKCCETNNYLPSIDNVYLEKENNSINIYFKCNYEKAFNYPIIYRYTLDENTTDFELLRDNKGTVKNNLSNSVKGKIVEKLLYDSSYDTESIIQKSYDKIDKSFESAEKLQSKLMGQKVNILSIEQNNRAPIVLKKSDNTENVYKLDNVWDKSKGGYKILENNNHMYGGYGTVLIYYNNKLYSKNVNEDWYVAKFNENRWSKYTNKAYIKQLNERIQKELAPSKNVFKDMARDIILRELLKLNPALKPFIRREGEIITFDKPVYIMNKKLELESGNKNFIMGIDQDSNLLGYFNGNPGRFMLRHHDLSLQLYNKVHITNQSNNFDILESQEGNLRFENSGDLSLAIYENGGVSFGSRLTRIPGNFFDMESEAFGYTMVANSVLEKFDFDTPIYYTYRRGFVKYDGKLELVRSESGKYQHKSNRQALNMLSNTMTNNKAISGHYPHKFVKINDAKLPKWSNGIPFMNKKIPGGDGAVSIGYYRIMNDQNKVLQHDGRNISYVSINQSRIRIPQEQPDSIWQLIKLNNDRIFFLNLVRVSVLNCWNNRWGTRDSSCGFSNGCYGEYFHLPGIYQKSGKDVKQYFSDYNKSVNSKNSNNGNKRVPWAGWGEENTYFHVDKGYVFKSLSLDQANCPIPNIERQTNNSNKLGTCPDGWRRGNNHQCYKPDNGYNQGSCTNPSYFSWNYDKRGWANGCNTSWTNRDILKRNEVAGVGIPNGDRSGSRRIRKVRLYHIRNDNEAFLHPAEIEVYDLNNNNIARGKQVTTSQLYPGSKPASAVVDGNISGTWNNGNCCVHTRSGKDVFIEIDLGAEYNVSKIKIYNRDDSNNCGQCPGRMNNARVRCSDNNNKVVLDFNTGANWNNNPKEYSLVSSLLLSIVSKDTNTFGQNISAPVNGGVATFKLPENPSNNDIETNLYLHPDIHGSRFKIPQQTPGCNVKTYKNRGVSGHVILEELEYIPQIQKAIKQIENFENLVKEQSKSNSQKQQKPKNLVNEVIAGNDYLIDNIMNINNTENLVTEGFVTDTELSSNSIVDSYIGLNIESPGKKHIKIAHLKVSKGEEKSLTIEIYPSKKDLSATKQVLTLVLSNNKEFVFLYNSSGEKEYKNFENINVYKNNSVGSLVEYTVTMEIKDVDHKNKASNMPVRYILNNVILNNDANSDYIAKSNLTQTVDVSTLGSLVSIKYIMEPSYAPEFELKVLEKKRTINDVLKLFENNLNCPTNKIDEKCSIFQEIITETLDLLSLEVLGVGNNQTLKIKNKNLVFSNGLYLLNGNAAYEMKVDNDKFGIKDFNNNSLYNPKGKNGANLIMDGANSRIGTTGWGGLNMNNWSFQDWSGFRISKVSDIYTGSMLPEYRNSYSSGCANCGNVGTNGNWGCRTFDNLKDAAEACIKCNNCNAVTRWNNQYQLRSSSNTGNSPNNESTWLKNYPNVKNSKRKIWKNTIVKLYESGGMVLRSINNTNTGHINYSYYWAHADTPKARNNPYQYKIGYNDDEHDNV